MECGSPLPPWMARRKRQRSSATFTFPQRMIRQSTQPEAGLTRKFNGCFEAPPKAVEGHRTKALRASLSVAHQRLGATAVLCRLRAWKGFTKFHHRFGRNTDYFHAAWSPRCGASISVKKSQPLTSCQRFARLILACLINFRFTLVTCFSTPLSVLLKST